MKYTILLCFCLLQLSIISNSQIINFKSDNYWISSGVGQYFTSDKSHGFSWEISVNLEKNYTNYQIRFLNSQEFILFGPSPSEKFNSFSLLIGKAITDRYIHFTFSIGIGLTTGVKRGALIYTKPSQGFISLNDPKQYGKESFISPSIPIDLSLMVEPIKYLAIEVTFFGDINYKRPIYGLLIKIVVGKLR